MHSGNRALLDASDIGLEPGSEAYADFASEVGAEAPWPIDMIQTYFDRRYAGWDTLPDIPVSSPLSHLRGLAEVFSCEDSAAEAFCELTNTLKHTMLRQMCRQQIPSDEANFLLKVLERTAFLWMVEKQQRALAEKRASVLCAEAREEEASAAQEAIAAIKAEQQQQLQAMAAEVEMHEKRADQCQQEAEKMWAIGERSATLEASNAALEREHRRLEREHEGTCAELRELKAKLAAVIAERDDQESMVAELTRRARRAESTKEDVCAAQLQAGGDAISPEAQARQRMRFKRAAGAVVAMMERSEVGMARVLFWAWRCHYAEGRHDAMKKQSLAQVSEANGASRALEMLACQALVKQTDTKPGERSVSTTTTAVQTEVVRPSMGRPCLMLLAVVAVLLALALAVEPYL